MNNPICLNSNSYHGFTLEEAVEGAKRAGIKLIELAGVIGWTEHVHNNFSDAQVAKVKFNRELRTLLRGMSTTQPRIVGTGIRLVGNVELHGGTSGANSF